MVSLGVILVALTGLARVATGTFVDIAFARERQAATGVLDQSLERVRALPYDTVKVGHLTSDLAGAAGVSGSGTTAAPYRLTLTNERLPHGSNPPVVPLVPNTSSVVVNGLTFNTRVFVTYFDDDPLSGALRITAEVSWSSSLRGSAQRTVRGQTILFSPAGCLSTATHPFAAPCQAFSYAAAGTQHGAITTSSDNFFGATISQASIDTPATSSTMQLEQLASLTSGSTSSGARLVIVGLADQQSGFSPSSARANTDPTSAGSVPSSTSTAVATTGGTLSRSGAGNVVDLVAPAADAGSSASTVAAASTQCPNLAGTDQTDGEPCGRASALQGGALGSTVNFTNPGLGLMTVAEVLAPPSAAGSFTNRDLTPSGVCTGTTGNGCVHAKATRSLGRIRIGGLPAGMIPPPGWAGYLVAVTDFADTVSTEAGIGADAPTVAASGTITYWTGAGYATLAIAPGVSQALPVSTLEVASGTLVLQLTPTISTGGTTASSTGSTCGGAACITTATASSRSPITGELVVRLLDNGTELAALTVRIDLGSALADTSYTHPASA